MTASGNGASATIGGRLRIAVRIAAIALLLAVSIILFYLWNLVAPGAKVSLHLF